MNVLRGSEVDEKAQRTEWGAQKLASESANWGFQLASSHLAEELEKQDGWKVRGGRQ